jgi:hypothetical protein
MDRGSSIVFNVDVCCHHSDWEFAPSKEITLGHAVQQTVFCRCISIVVENCI